MVIVELHTVQYRAMTKPNYSTAFGAESSVSIQEISTPDEMKA